MHATAWLLILIELIAAGWLPAHMSAATATETGRVKAMDGGSGDPPPPPPKP